MSKYHKQIRTETVDVYDILAAFEVTNPATQHAIKKLLMPGQRGEKSVLKDLREARDSITRAIEMVEEQQSLNTIEQIAANALNRAFSDPEYLKCIGCGHTFLDALLTEGVCPECPVGSVGSERRKAFNDASELLKDKK